MNQRQSRYSLQSGTQVPPASLFPSPSPLPEVGGGSSMSNAPPNSYEYVWRVGPQETPATPTRNARASNSIVGGTRPRPLPHPTATSAVASALLADASPSSPALGPRPRTRRVLFPPTRRVLFPRAPHSGQGTRPLPAVGHTPGGANAAITSSNNVPTFSTRSAVSGAALGGPMPHRRESPAGLPSWLVGSAPLREEMGGTVVAAQVVVGDGHPLLRNPGERGHAALVGNGAGTSGQLAKPSVLEGLAASSPASRSVANPVAAPPAGSAGSTFVGSGDPSARYLGETSDALAGGSGAVAVHDQLAWGGHGGAEWLTGDEVSQEPGQETAYPDPLRFLRGHGSQAPTTTGAAPPPHFPIAAAGIHPTSATAHSAHSFPTFEMAATGLSINSGNQTANANQTESATVSSNQRNSTQTASGSAAVPLSDAFIDPALFATATSPPEQQQPALDQPLNQDSALSSMNTMEPSVVQQSTENEQIYENQVAQNDVSNSATDETGISHATPNGMQAAVSNMQATTNGMYGPANGVFIGSAQIQLSYYTNDPHFGLDNLPKNADLSTVAYMGSDMGIPRSQATSSGYKGFGDNKRQDDSIEDEEDDHSNNSSIDEADDEDDEPTPHLPGIHPALIYNPHYNPAAAFWTPLPGVANMAGRFQPVQQPQRINMFDPPIPAFDTDPSLPFAPWRVNQLPPFVPEACNRVITISARHLAAVGRLYPDATFLISRYPASNNFTTRMKGTALATSAALHLPMFTDPAQSHNAARDDENDDNSDNRGPGDDGPTYIAALIQRDWPIGGVAFFPYNATSAAFIANLQNTFDVLPHGQEAFYFLVHDVQYADGSVGVGKGVWVCRAYEGRKGPQDRRLVEWWMEERGREGGAEYDGLGREVLIRMGEAFIEVEKWPRAGRGGGRRKRGGGAGGGTGRSGGAGGVGV